MKLQAKVHIAPNEALEFCQLLVERKICTWVLDDDVLEVSGQKVLNGLFAVGKGSFVENSDIELQRTIMNLIPTNSVFKQSHGGTNDLPNICQYLSLVLHGDECLRYFQSDMSSAFYLFRIPLCWSRMMAFNISFKGEELGLQKGLVYRPGCAVIPMGWGSAVSVMQELADRLTVLARLPAQHQVRRQAPLPPWMTEVFDASSAEGRPWYHVYLDNFCAMEKGPQGFNAGAGEAMHQALEDSWQRTGVLSSAKKKVVAAPTVQELGAELQGDEGTMGPSGLRVLKLIQSTLVALSTKRLKRKWIQVIAGRWVHCMSFRRPTMVCLDATWQFIGGKRCGTQQEAKVRGELFGCCCIALLIHSNLKANVSSVTTASDASTTGGAVGRSQELTLAGSQFAGADRANLVGGKVVPIMVLSLFNGIGCCFRCYDLIGIMPLVAISYELNQAANRVTSRRWPNVRLEKDVRDLTIEVIREWRYLYPTLEEIHYTWWLPMCRAVICTCRTPKLGRSSERTFLGVCEDYQGDQAGLRPAFQGPLCSRECGQYGH